MYFQIFPVDSSIYFANILLYTPEVSDSKNVETKNQFTGIIKHKIYILRIIYFFEFLKPLKTIRQEKTLIKMFLLKGCKLKFVQIMIKGVGSDPNGRSNFHIRKYRKKILKYST